MDEPAARIPGPSQSSTAGKGACVQCRTVKMRCKAVPGQPICERCTRKAFHCVFQQKKRGRKPGSRINPSPQDRSKEGSASTHESHRNVLAKQPPGQVGPSASSSHSAVRESSPSTRARAESRLFPPSNSLQPLSLLNARALEGEFSLDNILSTKESGQQGMSQNLAPMHGDPIIDGLISYHVGASLFHGFMTNMNPLVCLLDPELYTFQYVKERSPFLLTVILAAAARAFNPDLHSKLYQSAEAQFVESFRRGSKSVEVIQAIVLFTYWKRSDDSRSWASVGYAIRLCMELGWHRLSARDTSSSPKLPTDLESRQTRNIERTWLVLFVYDRSWSLQTRKPWMIEKSEFIESVNAWYKSPYAISNDALLCALVTLRLTTADIIEVLDPQRPSPPLRSPHRINSLLRMLKPQLDAWQKYWTCVTEAEPCHRFLVSFFSNHVQLYLYAFPLQESLSLHIGGPLIDSTAFWVAYTSALGMLKSITDPSIFPILCFIHDSVHVMIAYAAIFLIKLLLSVHQSIRQEIESSILETMKTTVRVLTAQETPADFSCSLQAKFLSNALREYEKARRRQSAKKIQNEHVARVTPATTDIMDDTTSPPTVSHRQSSTVLGGNSSAYPGRQAHDVNAAHQSSTDAERTSQARTNEHMGPMDISSDFLGNTALMETRPSNENNSPLETVGAQTADWTFGNDDVWSAMFLNAGFDISEGVFLPDISA